MVEVFGDCSGIADLNELEVVLGGCVRVVHDLGDEDGSDLRSEIFGAKGIGHHADECSCS